MFSKYISRGSLSDESTLNELVGEVYQIQADCVRDFDDVIVDHGDNIWKKS